MKSELRQWGKGEILSEWPWVREWERKDEAWENEKGRELCRLRGNMIFCLFKVSSKFKMLSFVFCIYLFFTRIWTWFKASFNLIRPISTNTIRFDPNWRESANKKKGHATDTHVVTWGCGFGIVKVVNVGLWVCGGWPVRVWQCLAVGLLGWGCGFGIVEVGLWFASDEREEKSPVRREEETENE